MVSARPRPRPDPALVLTKAFLRAGDKLELPRRLLARVIGVSEATLSRVAAGRALEPGTKPGELALLFLRLVRSLDALVGGDAAKARAWLLADNAHLAGRPIDRIQQVSGLVHVLDHLDALRGRL